MYLYSGIHLKTKITQLTGIFSLPYDYIILGFPVGSVFMIFLDIYHGSDIAMT